MNYNKVLRNNINNINYRKFICSSEYFSGFFVMINIDEIHTMDDIITTFYNKLINILQNNNFEKLIEIAGDRNFHIHSYEIEDILSSSPNDVFYICDHC